MVKVYMYIYAMIMFFSVFITITSGIPCEINSDCRDHVCSEPDIPVCGFLSPVSPGIGTCGCYKYSTLEIIYPE
ncbi:unnamed protein product [Trifolium pratense]|uniref:Uncharacterized protein n=1 Tax=Trifolium pratense TaxID=57577 RepID=A0ACB0LCJ1_TRIPR|nr:unnamed protein product [Trifolium pratense]